MYVKLGNRAAIERPQGLATDAGEVRDAGSVVELDGDRVTTVNFPEGDAAPALIEAFLTVTAPGGVWAQHSTQPPTWVDSDNDALASLIAENYGCKIGEPKNVEATHHTEAGPPGIGPDGGDAIAEADAAHERWERDVIAKLEADAKKKSLTEAQRADAARQAELRRESLDKPKKRAGRGSAGLGFGGTLLTMFAIAYFVWTRIALRTDAGKDFQSKVMGDTASTGTGAYAAGNYVALTENTGAPAAGDTALTGELTGFGLARVQGTYAHTAGAASYTITKTFTSSDATTRTIHKAALFNAASTGTMPFESVLPADAILVSGDTLTITWTINI